MIDSPLDTAQSTTADGDSQADLVGHYLTKPSQSSEAGTRVPVDIHVRKVKALYPHLTPE